MDLYFNKKHRFVIFFVYCTLNNNSWLQNGIFKGIRQLLMPPPLKSLNSMCFVYACVKVRLLIYTSSWLTVQYIDSIAYSIHRHTLILITSCFILTFFDNKNINPKLFLIFFFHIISFQIILSFYLHIPNHSKPYSFSSFLSLLANNLFLYF